jgi:lysophospholipase L1-like esterase
VYSILERLQAAGAHPAVVDAATSGRKMLDAPRQAQIVAAAAASLRPGQTAYVTFGLGTNDLCDDPKTDPSLYESRLRFAIATLRSSLPSGSRILMLSVPDFAHFREITQADPSARNLLALVENSRRCAPFLGIDSPTTLVEAQAILDAYNASLERVCAEIEAADGPTGRLHCTFNAALLSNRDFAISDLSVVDYFHPSIAGQAKMAEAAWQADLSTALVFGGPPPGMRLLASPGLFAIAPVLHGLGRRPRFAT